MKNKTQPEQRRIQVGDVPVAYQVAGEGRPVVLVHGLSGSTQWWAKNVDALAEHFCVYTIDLIGFGENRGKHPFILDEASRLIVRWMEHLGIERTHLIGHSMGGFIAADLAADAPDRVERLVLVDAAGLPFNPNYTIHARGLARAVRYLPRDFVPVLMRDALRAGPKTMTSAIRQILRSDLRHKLTQIHLPTLVIWGEYDTLIPVEVGRELSKALSDVEFVVLPGAGHNPMWDRALAFNQAVLKFLLAQENNPAPALNEAQSTDDEEAPLKLLRQ